jgi:hypothetical protein
MRELDIREYLEYQRKTRSTSFASLPGEQLSEARKLEAEITNLKMDIADITRFLGLLNMKVVVGS